MTAVDERGSAATDQNPAVHTDLGFGSVVARESRTRLLNRDGTFNARRTGLPYWQSLSAYHYLLTISWPKFLAWVVTAFLSANGAFALIFVLLGDGALAGTAERASFVGRFGEAFFFSVHTLATIGYGTIAPASLAAHLVVTLETLIGLVGVAVVAGISFGRFSRPAAQILFSRNAVIAPYGDGRAFMFRIVNQRTNQLVNLETQVLLSRRADGSTAVNRDFVPLKLERDRVVFFPLSWTIVHPIDETSPLRGWTEEDLAECDAEFLVLLNGFDETFSQTVHTRSSYKLGEVVWGAKFVSMFNPPDASGAVSVDVRKLHDIEPFALPHGIPRAG